MALGWPGCSAEELFSPGDQALRERGTGSSQYTLTPGAGDTSPCPECVPVYTHHLSESTPKPLLHGYCCSVAKPCLALCDPMDCCLPGSSVHGISQARILEWVAISYSKHLPDPGIEPTAPLGRRFFTTEPSGSPWVRKRRLHSKGLLQGERLKDRLEPELALSIRKVL